jgi:uncharacterized protein
MNQIVYTDAVFGRYTITEPVIVDLVNCPALQRLQDVDQAGYPKPFFPQLKKHTRFEHSLGVYLLLLRYGASLEEQIAGLIHDVSHSAFSHCADYTLGSTEAGKTQSHQDNVFESYVRKSAIPQILSHHGLNVDTILDDRRFPLKEQSLPDLCADRIDYSLRSSIAAGIKTQKETDQILEKLSTNGTQWFFKDSACAREYAELFLFLNATLWCGLSSAVMFKTVGDCLRYAFLHNYVSQEDFYKTDSFVLKKIQSHLETDAQLQELYDRMNNKVPFVHGPSCPQHQVFCKSRAVDPLCIYEGQLERLSTADPSWQSCIQKESAPKSYCIQFAQ